MVVLGQVTARSQFQVPEVSLADVDRRHRFRILPAGVQARLLIGITGRLRTRTRSILQLPTVMTRFFPLLEVLVRAGTIPLEEGRVEELFSLQRDSRSPFRGVHKAATPA